MNDQSSNNRETVDSWYEKVVSSCSHHDSEQAYSAWRKWDEMTLLVSPEQKSELVMLQEKLAYTAFPSFPQDIAASLIEKHLVSFLRSSVDIDEMIRNRFLYLGYGFEESDRKALREAALKNTELVGEKKASEWLGSLDGALAKAEDPGSVMMQFFTQDQSITALSRLDQAILRRLFQVYYDFLAFPVMTVYGLAETARKLEELEKAGVKEINVKEFFAPDRTAPQDFASDIPQNAVSSRQFSSDVSEKVNLPLLKALGKFEKLGGQQVTNSKIVVKGQNDPVRPTIFNWLRAYRDELGVGAHDSVVRGQFLFHSLNGKGLSSDERDQVGMLLKSIDENIPLSIDPERQEVVFSHQPTINSQQSAVSSQQLTDSREQIQNTKYQIQNTTSLSSDGGKNISRAVFELPTINQQPTINNQQSHPSPSQTQELPSERGAGRGMEIGNGPTRNDFRSNSGRLSAFEQAKAIQAAARENQISMAKVASETVELGRVNTFPSAPPMAPRPRIEPAPQSTAPAPRSISFEPAKIDTFSFGASTVAPHEINKEFHGVNRVPSEKSNVGSVSFSTKHVMQAEKEATSLSSDDGKQITTSLASDGGKQKMMQVPIAPAPPIQKPVAPVNRYRITPTSRREETVKDDTPSPHVVDLRG